MSSNFAIRAEGLGKRYRIGARQPAYHTLRDSLAEAARSLFRPRKSRAHIEDTIWALRDVSLEVPAGDVLGIIGRNGSGKSTLLKILSRITEPSEGRAETLGRVGSLLEVGTGFHLELTGRENIFLSGAICGMRKFEIARRFDEIVAFAGTEQFLDTPVKHYSTGMYLRLAFSVAAHLEADILLVDEVLAVGDAAFQAKCLGKMGQVAVQGRTVVLVSHQLNQIRRLCDRCVWLDSGQFVKLGPTADVVSAYEAKMSSAAAGPAERDANGSPAWFVKWRLRESDAGSPYVLRTTGPVSVEFTVQVARQVRRGHHGIALFGAENQLMWANSSDHLRLEKGVRTLVHTLPCLPLRPGNYSWQVSLYDEGERLDLWDASPALMVATHPVTHPNDRWQGILNVPSSFEAE